MFRRPLRAYYSRNPWSEIEQLQRDMNRLFEGVSGHSRPRVAPGFPAMNIWTNQDGAVVTAELPGVDPEDIDISVVGETLTLTGTRQPLEMKNGDKYHRRERHFGKFTRSFTLPFNVEAENVEAAFDKGVLHISLPRAEAEKPRKISVKAGS